MKPVVTGDAVEDGGVVPSDDAGDLAEAVAAMGMVTNEPPELVAGGSHSTASATTAQLTAADAATGTHGIGEVEQTATGKLVDDVCGVGHTVHGCAVHGEASLAGSAVVVRNVGTQERRVDRAAGR